MGFRKDARVPQWFDDAKLGVFLHWGLYSVPAWAPQVSNIQQLLLSEGPKQMLRSNPYAEWYLNTMQIRDSPTQVHHRQTYGADYPYDNFVRLFDTASGAADLDALASLCKQGGAQYVVLTTKHHEGFTLWPSSLAHPKKGHYHTQRDLVGDFSDAVRAQRMRMGLYYSGGYDWPFNDAVLKGAADTILAMSKDPAYREYAIAHVRELIDRYQPLVLWNDIGWPGGGNLAELFAYYYDTVEDRVVNDRWTESTMRSDRATEFAMKAGGEAAQLLWRFIPESKKELAFAGAKHVDFTTPEYATLDHIAPKKKKWDAGHSFGANRNERPEGIVTTELVRSFCDIVSKNGNLLIGIGPAADGSISAEQQVPLLGLGAWLDINGEAIFGTRPWQTAEGLTAEYRCNRRHRCPFAWSQWAGWGNRAHDRRLRVTDRAASRIVPRLRCACPADHAGQWDACTFLIMGLRTIRDLRVHRDVLKVTISLVVPAQHSLECETCLLHHARRADVARKAGRLDAVKIQRVETVCRHEFRRLGGVSLVPVGDAQPVTDLATRMLRRQVQPDRSDLRVISKRNGPRERGSRLGFSLV